VPAASLPDDDLILARLLGYGRDLKGWKKVRAAGGLRGWVKCSDGRLYHPVVAAKAQEAHEHKTVSKRKRDKDAERLRRWRETHDGNDDETRFVAERPDRNRPDLTGPDHDQTGPDQPSPPGAAPPPAAPVTTPGDGRARVIGIDKPGLKAAIEDNDAIGIVRAFGGNLADDRPAEWVRDADGLQLLALATLLWWRRSIRDPIREPSGLRACRAAWAALSPDRKRETANEVRTAIGLPESIKESA
jgi:hypothetical protein